MTTRLLTAALLLGLSLGTQALAGGAGAPPPTLQGLPAEYRADQAKRQASRDFETLRRPLDFGPYKTALSQVTPRRAELDRLILGADAAGLGALQKAGHLDAQTLVAYYAERIRRYDVGKLNAVLELNPRALQEAAALDAERRAGRVRSPLHGLVVLLKDNVAAAGMHNTAGAAALRDVYPDQDAALTRRLREAGVIILGKTNLSEWANFMSLDSVNGYSVLGGHTRNPYGAFEVGGSSSGSAAAAAANFATFTVGTETAGSLIYPAGQTATASLKPTLGLVSRDRIIPISEAQDTAGPMARSVSDLNTLFSAMVGADPNDPATRIAPRYQPPARLDAGALRGRRVALALPDGLPAPLRQSIRAQLEKAGAVVVPIRWKVADVNMLPVLFYGMKHDVAAYLKTTRAPYQSLAQIVAFNQADPKTRAPYGQELLVQSLSPGELNPKLLSRAEYEAAVARNRAVTRQNIDRQLQAAQAEFVLTFSNSLSGEYAVAGYPALTVPAGFLPSGEPYGVTFVGTALSDAKLIQAAYAFEQAAQARREPKLK